MRFAIYLPTYAWEYPVLAPLDYDLEQLDRIAEEIVPRFPLR